MVVYTLRFRLRTSSLWRRNNSKNLSPPILIFCCLKNVWSSTFGKDSALWNYGMHLSERFENETGFSLHQINDFYVEVTYNVPVNAITKFTSFKTATKLQPYLDKIDILEISLQKNIHILLVLASKAFFRIGVHVSKDLILS
jgi:hypothetical protein